jgi:TPR repeat protein
MVCKMRVHSSDFTWSCLGALVLLGLAMFAVFKVPHGFEEQVGWYLLPRHLCLSSRNGPRQIEKNFWLKAQRGDRGSQMWLGAAYEQGWFGKPNFHEALKWFRKAAAQRDPDAQNSLGQMYQDGEGVQQNCTEAAKWYRMAAEHVPDFGGAGQGRNNLGLLYLSGDGVPKDYVQAYMWFKLTAHETNLTYAKAQMTPAQIVEAERMVTEWKRSHPEQ